MSRARFAKRISSLRLPCEYCTSSEDAKKLEIKLVSDKTTAAPGDIITYTVYVGPVTKLQKLQNGQKKP